MQVVKAKDLRASGGGRLGGAGVGSDVMRVFNRALELLGGSAADSETELLDMVKRAKLDAEAEALNPSKKGRSGRGPAETSEPLQALGHRPSPVGPSNSQVTEQTSSSQHGDAGGEPVAGSAGNPSMTQAQARLMNVIRGGPGRGRIEKPRRKATR